MIEFVTDPVVRILGPDRFQLAEDFIVRVVDHTIVAPAGFVSDLESVPRLPVIYTLFKNRAPKSAVLHDWLYHQRTFSRSVCDDVFLDAMRVEGVAWWVRRSMYLGVRIGGGAAYAFTR